MLYIEKYEDCPHGCLEGWNYDAQQCSACGYDALKPHDCMEATTEFRLQNDREWREKLEHALNERAKLRRVIRKFMNVRGVLTDADREELRQALNETEQE